MAKKKEAPVYAVTIERGESGWWIATAIDLDGCHTQGKSIAQAKARIREAMGLYDVPEDAEIEFGVRWHDEAKLSRVREMRMMADKINAETQRATKAFASDLVGQGVSLRDVGELLGVSFQRVQQLVK